MAHTFSIVFSCAFLLLFSDCSGPQDTPQAAALGDVAPAAPPVAQPEAATTEAVVPPETAEQAEPAEQSAIETAVSEDVSQPARDVPTPAAAALATVFSPARAPEQKTMGLMQRSFLDLAEQAGGPLQIAIVVDGTESMASELAGVRQTIHQMIDDLERYRGNQVETALVIYRDIGSPSGEVVVPLKSFTRDREALKKATEQLVPETGAPFFHELVDVGIHTALEQLEWSVDPQTARWILLFGDAPPYDETFRDPRFPAARRRYATDLLIALAVRKGIRVNSVLCTSDEATVAPYDAALAETRQFMSALASGTDGLMLDLSYPDIRTALVESSRTPAVKYVAVTPITADDLAAARRRLFPDGEASGGSTQQDVRVAVVPHMPLERMSFDPAEPAVQVSTALRHSFSRLPGVRVVSPIDIQKQLRRLRADSIGDDQRLRALAARLGADYVIWGSTQPDAAVVQTAAYRRSDGNRVVQVSLAGDESSMTRVLLSAAARSPEEQEGGLGGLLKRIEDSVTTKVFETTWATTAATQKELLAAIEALDQALGLAAGSEESSELLDRASRSLQAAAAAEPRNAVVHWLDANVRYNRAMRLYSIGDAVGASEQMKQMGTSLARANRARRELADEALATEIEADYALMVRRDVPAAIALYQKLTEATNPPASRLRGHWMLAGIFAGDWGVDPSHADPAAAREQLVNILAGWERSPEADLLRKWMRWDDAAGITRYSYLPAVNEDLASEVPEEGELQES